MGMLEPPLQVALEHRTAAAADADFVVGCGERK